MNLGSGSQSKVIVVAGLPGCGKSTYLKVLCRHGWRAFDDYKANAIGDSSEFRKSRWFNSLFEFLSKGDSCAIADIDFCRAEARKEVDDVIRDAFPNVKICWRFFEGDVRSCQENIKMRNRASVEDELRKLTEYASTYSVPDGADVASRVL